MARLDEIAEGIATVLASSPQPEPLSIGLRGEGQAEATFLVRAVIDGCERRGSPLSAVRIGTQIGADIIKQYEALPSGYQGIKIEGKDDLGWDIEFFRFPW